MLWGHNTDNYLLIVAETFIHTIYILQLKQPVHRLKMKILMLQCTNETTQTTMDTTLTTTFWILTITFIHTICRQQREQPVYRFKAKTLISLYTNETTQTSIFSIANNVWHKRQPIQPVFHNNNRFMYFPQQRHVYLIMFT